MSDTTPNEGVRAAEDVQGHKFLTDPGEVPTEGGRGQLPEPGDNDDAQGHKFAEEVLTSDGSENDTEGHIIAARNRDDGTDQDDKGEPFLAQ